MQKGTGQYPVPFVTLNDTTERVLNGITECVILNGVKDPVTFCNAKAGIYWILRRYTPQDDFANFLPPTVYCLLP